MKRGHFHPVFIRMEKKIIQMKVKTMKMNIYKMRTTLVMTK